MESTDQQQIRLEGSKGKTRCKNHWRLKALGEKQFLLYKMLQTVEWIKQQI